MDKKTQRNFIIAGILFVVSIIFTILLKITDVKPIGPEGSIVGFAGINQTIAGIVGFNAVWYHITNWMSIILIAIVLAYALIGFIQLVKHRSFKKVAPEIIALGVFYVVMIAVYVIFEKIFIINYRPVILDGVLEASYPSSHTLFTLCLCGSAILINQKIFKNKITKVLNPALVLVAFIIILGRLASGVHWFTDILGGVIISSTLLTFFSASLSLIEKPKKIVKK